MRGTAKTAVSPMPAPGQVMDTIDFLKRFAVGSRRNRGRIERACVLRKVYPPNAKESHASENQFFFFARQEIHVPRTRTVLLLFFYSGLLTYC